MGINFEPTQEDIELWMQMTDTNQDKQVSLEEFEELVLRSLEK
jgi:Ca2+-binding EF-hand superfamily protein